MSSKGKARADEVQETDDDAYGSDDPSCLPNARAGDEDGATQGSPKGHKRSRLNSAGEGVPVPIKGEKIKTLFEPLVRDADGCALLLVILPVSNTYPIFFKLCSRLNRSRSTAQLSYLRPCRIPSGSSSQYDHRSERDGQKQHSLCYCPRP
jgi:hypothetical protein